MSCSQYSDAEGVLLRGISRVLNSETHWTLGEYTLLLFSKFDSAWFIVK